MPATFSSIPEELVERILSLRSHTQTPPSLLLVLPGTPTPLLIEPTPLLPRPRPHIKSPITTRASPPPRLSHMAPHRYSSLLPLPHSAHSKPGCFLGFSSRQQPRIWKNAYLTLAGPAMIFLHLSEAVTRWHSLCLVGIHLCSRSGARLHSVSAVVPAIWNNALLEISANPALKSITLQPPAPQQPSPVPSSLTPSSYPCYPRSTSMPFSHVHAHAHGAYQPSPSITPSHLFLAEARKHSRLIELIRAGTPMVRARANTVGVVPFPTASLRAHAQSLSTVGDHMEVDESEGEAREVSSEAEGSKKQVRIATTVASAGVASGSGSSSGSSRGKKGKRRADQRGGVNGRRLSAV
ncbi:hypothetical protein NLI96_g6788 [Meripilus lineatus]|uniref:Uncharacterized protein n=1 Tax=Meripilus lineatus TaxID=2056292 RepID=A0AAD5V238_9APHY|nr:hypothetical protein NLI96_g6788 [Physisporinus lineatus]